MEYNQYEQRLFSLIAEFNKENKLNICRDIVQEAILSYRHNDAAHRVDHIYYVTRNALELTKFFKLNDRDSRIVIMAALLHDLGCRLNREQHEIIAVGLIWAMLTQGNYVDNTWAHPVENHFTSEEVIEITTAAMQHRASFKGERESLTSRLVAVADRGKPDVHTVIHRSVLFNLDKGLPRQEIIDNVVYHMQEKYSKDTGYMWKNYPKEGLAFYGEAWKEVTDMAADPDRVLALTKQDIIDYECGD